MSEARTIVNKIRHKHFTEQSYFIVNILICVNRL